MAATLTPPPLPQTGESDEALEAHVQRILRSPQFVRAETQRRLLEYLWQHRHKSLSEYTLATEALGRSQSFDGTSDASVRVHISRLRRKLKDYYEQEPAEPEMLVIPSGTYQLLVVDLPAVSDPIAAEAPQVDYRKRMWMMSAVAALFATATVSLLIGRAIQAKQSVNAPKLTAFWSAFLEGNAPVRIILPTPTFFQFSNNPNMRLRSTSVNDFRAIEKDPGFAALTKDLGTPRLEQSYTVTWDTLAAIDMARYLDTVSDKQRISFQVTRDSSMLMLEQANVIAMGTHQTLEPLHEYLSAMNFSLSLEEIEVVNAHPMSGEPARYSMVQQSTDRAVRPSVIAVLPGRRPGLKVLILESRDTSAIVSMLSSSAGSNSILEMLRKNGNPHFYEMVVLTESENNHALRSWPVAVHAFRSKAPDNSM